MSLSHPLGSPVESTDNPMIFTFLRSNSGLILAMYPSSVVQTGVKSFGCENKTAQELPIQSWNRTRPSVVSASKSGAMSPIFICFSSYFCLQEAILIRQQKSISGLRDQFTKLVEIDVAA